MPQTTVGLKKGTRVKVLDNPKNPESRFLGIATLITCQDRNAYTDFNAEVWKVRFDHTEEERNHIVTARDVVVDEK